MAPYSASEVAQNTARTMHRSKQSDFERDFGGKTKVLSNKKKPVRAMISSAKWLRSTSEE